jgi:hypothetical protein
MADDEDRNEQDGGGVDVEEQTKGQQSSAQTEAQDVERAQEEMHELEQGEPPKDLQDWPDGKAKYLTYGGPEGTAGYDEGPTRKLGPSSLEYQEDGSIEIEGEKVDNPDDYRADEPIPGAPSSGDTEEGERGGDSSFSDTADDGGATRSEAEGDSERSGGESAEMGRPGPGSGRAG